MSEHTKAPTRVAAGLKAAIHNPNVSAEAKENAMERLKEMGRDVEPTHASQVGHGVEDSTHVLAGYKATLSNPHTSPKAEVHAEEVLQPASIHEKHLGYSDKEHHTHVVAGYKAALHNPRVSEDGKQHVREYLMEHGIET